MDFGKRGDVMNCNPGEKIIGQPGEQLTGCSAGDAFAETIAIQVESCIRLMDDILVGNLLKAYPHQRLQLMQVRIERELTRRSQDQNPRYGG